MSYIKGSPSHWEEDMTDTVTIYKGATLDNYGKRTVSGTGKSYPCRVMSDFTKITTDQNRNMVEEGRLIILNDPDVALGDTMDTATGYKGIITRVDRKNYSANGTTTPHHVVVTFGRA